MLLADFLYSWVRYSGIQLYLNQDELYFCAMVDVLLQGLKNVQIIAKECIVLK